MQEEDNTLKNLEDVFTLLYDGAFDKPKKPLLLNNIFKICDYITNQTTEEGRCKAFADVMTIIRENEDFFLQKENYEYGARNNITPIQTILSDILLRAANEGYPKLSLAVLDETNKLKKEGKEFHKVLRYMTYNGDPSYPLCFLCENPNPDNLEIAFKAMLIDPSCTDELLEKQQNDAEKLEEIKVKNQQLGEFISVQRQINKKGTAEQIEQTIREKNEEKEELARTLRTSEEQTLELQQEVNNAKQAYDEARKAVSNAENETKDITSTEQEQNNSQELFNELDKLQKKHEAVQAKLNNFKHARKEQQKTINNQITKLQQEIEATGQEQQELNNLLQQKYDLECALLKTAIKAREESNENLLNQITENFNNPLNDKSRQDIQAQLGDLLKNLKREQDLFILQNDSPKPEGVDRKKIDNLEKAFKDNSNLMIQKINDLINRKLAEIKSNEAGVSEESLQEAVFVRQAAGSVQQLIEEQLPLFADSFTNETREQLKQKVEEANQIVVEMYGTLCQKEIEICRKEMKGMEEKIKSFAKQVGKELLSMQQEEDKPLTSDKVEKLLTERPDKFKEKQELIKKFTSFQENLGGFTCEETQKINEDNNKFLGEEEEEINEELSNFTALNIKKYKKSLVDHKNKNNPKNIIRKILSQKNGSQQETPAEPAIEEPEQSDDLWLPQNTSQSFAARFFESLYQPRYICVTEEEEEEEVKETRFTTKYQLEVADSVGYVNSKFSPPIVLKSEEPDNEIIDQLSQPVEGLKKRFYISDDGEEEEVEEEEEEKKEKADVITVQTSEKGSFPSHKLFKIEKDNNSKNPLPPKITINSTEGFVLVLDSLQKRSDELFTQCKKELEKEKEEKQEAFKEAREHLEKSEPSKESHTIVTEHKEETTEFENNSEKEEVLDNTPSVKTMFVDKNNVETFKEQYATGLSKNNEILETHLNLIMKNIKNEQKKREEETNKTYIKFKQNIILQIKLLQQYTKKIQELVNEINFDEEESRLNNQLIANALAILVPNFIELRENIIEHINEMNNIIESIHSEVNFMNEVIVGSAASGASDVLDTHRQETEMTQPNH